ncbi:MAG: SDR family NAD(P)-dependent oxidoreductase [Ignavibacteria bacterium]
MTGGTKGLGLLFAKYLADNGAKHLALISRGEVPDESINDFDAIKSNGVEINIYKADITDKIELKKVIDLINKAGHNLKGIIQSTGVLDDGVISNQTKEKLKKYSVQKFRVH